MLCNLPKALPSLCAEKAILLGVQGTRDRIVGGNDREGFKGMAAVLPLNLDIPHRAIVFGIVFAVGPLMATDAFEAIVLLSISSITLSFP